MAGQRLPPARPAAAGRAAAGRRAGLRRPAGSPAAAGTAAAVLPLAGSDLPAPLPPRPSREGREGDRRVLESPGWSWVKGCNR